MVSKPARLPSGVRLSGITAGCLPLTPEFFNEGQANCKAVRYIALRLFLCFECLNDLFTKVLGVGFHSPLPCLMFTVHATATRSKENVRTLTHRACHAQAPLDYDVPSAAGRPGG